MKTISFILLGATAIMLIAAPTGYAQTKELRVSDLPYQQSQAQDLQPILTQNEPTREVETQPQVSPALNSALQAKEIFFREGFYGSISGDARFLNQTTVQPVDINLDFNTGYGVNAALGYRFRNHLRLEAEFSYGSNDIGEVGLPRIPATTNTITTNVTTPAVPLTIATPITTPVAITVPGFGIIPPGAGIPAGTVLNAGPPLTNAAPITIANGITIPAGTNLSIIPGLTTTGGTAETTAPVETAVTTPEVPAATVEASGKITTLSGLLNLYYDFSTNSRFEPYVGGGIGVSRAAAENVTATYPGINISEEITGSSTVLVYQLMAGVAYNLDSRTALTLGYRYFNVARQSFQQESVGEVRADGLGVHNIELGLRYWF